MQPPRWSEPLNNHLSPPDQEPRESPQELIPRRKCSVQAGPPGTPHSSGEMGAHQTPKDGEQLHVAVPARIVVISQSPKWHVNVRTSVSTKLPGWLAGIRPHPFPPPHPPCNHGAHGVNRQLARPGLRVVGERALGLQEIRSSQEQLRLG